MIKLTEADLKQGGGLPLKSMYMIIDKNKEKAKPKTFVLERGLMMVKNSGARLFLNTWYLTVDETFRTTSKDGGWNRNLLPPPKHWIDRGLTHHP